MKKQTDAVREFFNTYPPNVRDTAESLREVIRSAIPDAREMLDVPDRVVGYGFGPGYADLICTIIPSKTGVKLGIVRGAQVPDPQQLLEGAGKKHRYVAFPDSSRMRDPAVRALLQAAVAEWRKHLRD